MLNLMVETLAGLPCSGLGHRSHPGVSPVKLNQGHVARGVSWGLSLREGFKIHSWV